MLQKHVLDIAVKALIVCGCCGICLVLCCFTWCVFIEYSIDIGIEVSALAVVVTVLIIVAKIAASTIAFIVFWTKWHDYKNAHWR